MTLLLIPLAGVVLGVAAYLGLRAAGVFNVLGGEPEPWRPTREAKRPHPAGPTSSWPRFGYGVSLTERAEQAPRGCLYAIIGVTAVWILGWLVVLVIGLNILS